MYDIVAGWVEVRQAGRAAQAEQNGTGRQETSRGAGLTGRDRKSADQDEVNKLRTAAAETLANDDSNCDHLCVHVLSGAASSRQNAQPSLQRPSYRSPLLLIL